jgi:transcriptional regulator with XRE-family HTH domain
MANDRLRGAITSAGMTAADLAGEIGVDPKTVERWISKNRIPHRRHRMRAAALLGANEAYLWPAVADDPTTKTHGRAELVEFFPTRSAVPVHLWRTLIDTATERFDYLAYAGLFLQEHHDTASRLKARATAGVQVRILLGDPDSAAVMLRGLEEGLGEGMASRVSLSLRYLDGLRDTDGIEVRVHETTLYNSILRSDDTLLANTHVYGAPAAQSPVLHLRRVPGGTVFDHYAGSFERIWQDSRRWEPEYA